MSLFFFVFFCFHARLQIMPHLFFVGVPFCFIYKSSKTYDAINTKPRALNANMTATRFSHSVSSQASLAWRVANIKVFE